MNKILKLLVGALCVLGLLVVVAALFAPSDNVSTAVTDEKMNSPVEGVAAEETQQAPETAAKTATVYSIGDRVVCGDLAYTVTDMTTAGGIGGSEFGAKPDGIFMIVTLQIDNLGKETKTVDSSYVKAIDSQGRTFESDNEAWAYLEDNLFFKQVQPGLPAKGQIVFDVPKGESFNLQVTDSIFGGNEELIAVGST